MENRSLFTNLTQLIIQDKKLSFTILSYASIAVIFFNLATVKSPIIGIAASIPYILINATFIGHALFKNENSFTKFLLGCLLVLVTLGLTGWVIMILHNLDYTRTAIVLFVTASLASTLSKRMNSDNETE